MPIVSTRRALRALCTLRATHALCALYALASPALQAQPIIEAPLGRSQAGAEVVIRGWLEPAPQPNGALLLVFPGWPGIPRFEWQNGSPTRLYLQQHVQEARSVLHAAGISIMTVDCPTDQWGVRGFNPTACSDGYRSSVQHADDVRALIRAAQRAGPYTRIFVKGHSYGAVSSHWLALRLGDELAGSIHSATQSVPGGGPYVEYASTVTQVTASRLPRTSIYLHHRDDLCRFTPYDFAKAQGVHGIMTVTGGDRWSDPCGKASFHSYAGRTQEVGQALVKWINEGVITPVIRGAGD